MEVGAVQIRTLTGISPASESLIRFVTSVFIRAIFSKQTLARIWPSSFYPQDAASC
jgi:hypothetical protein